MAAPKRVKNQDIAQDFISDERYCRNILYVREWNMFCIYQDGYYKPIPNDDFLKLVYDFVREKYGAELNITMNICRDIMGQVGVVAPKRVENVSSPYIALQDKLYNTTTFEFEDFDDEKIAFHHIACHTNDLGMETPTFMAFLKTTLIDNTGRTDNELVNLVQQMMGYYLLNDLKAQVAFFLVGRGANGKSVLINIIEEMIGKDYVSAMSIQSLTMNNFATANLVGKKVNLCNEEESKYLRSDKFKALISGDLTEASRKFEHSFFFHPQTKYLFATNNMPSFDGVNHGIRRRMKIIPFKRVFEAEEQDRNLTEKLKTELPGILKWAMEGAKTLVNNGYSFVTSALVQEALIEFENNNSSALMFFRETYEPTPIELRSANNFISSDELYVEYREWCDKNGKKAMSESNFRKDLHENVFRGEDTIARRRDGVLKRGRHVTKLQEFEVVGEASSYQEIIDMFEKK